MARSRKRQKAFVAMPFGKSMRDKRRFDTIYMQIQGACSSLGVATQRANSNVSANSIIQHIYDLMFEADLMIFDLTDNRPNVYYELGVADGMEVPDEVMLLISNARTTVHFDVANRRVHQYRNPAQLQALLSQPEFAQMVAGAPSEWRALGY